MVRLICALFALVIALAAVSLALYGADHLFLKIQPLMHFRWFTSLFAVFFPVSVAVALAIKANRKKQETKPDEDVPLAPLVRRQPSGMREL